MGKIDCGAAFNRPLEANRFNNKPERSAMMYKVKMSKNKQITIQQAAQILEVNPETLRRWDRKGKFIAKRHPINGYRMYDLSSIKVLKKKIEKGEGLDG